MNIHAAASLTNAGELPRKKVKTVPIQLVQNGEREPARMGFTKCKLHFD